MGGQRLREVVSGLGPEQQGRLLGRGLRVAVCVLGVALVPIVSLILWSVCVSLAGLSPFLSFCCWPFRIWLGHGLCSTY